MDFFKDWNKLDDEVRLDHLFLKTIHVALNVFRNNFVKQIVCEFRIFLSGHGISFLSAQISEQLLDLTSNKSSLILCVR